MWSPWEFLPKEKYKLSVCFFKQTLSLHFHATLMEVQITSTHPKRKMKHWSTWILKVGNVNGRSICPSVHPYARPVRFSPANAISTSSTESGIFLVCISLLFSSPPRMASELYPNFCGIYGTKKIQTYIMSHVL